MIRKKSGSTDVVKPRRNELEMRRQSKDLSKIKSIPNKANHKALGNSNETCTF